MKLVKAFITISLITFVSCGETQKPETKDLDSPVYKMTTEIPASIQIPKKDSS